MSIGKRDQFEHVFQAGLVLDVDGCVFDPGLFVGIRTNQIQIQLGEIGHTMFFCYIFDKDKEGKRIRKQLEVDFVVNQGNQRYYIQVAYDMTSEEKQTQEFNSLRNIPDSFKKMVIVNGSKKPWRNDEGFVIMGMKYFLLNADSLEF